MTITLEEAQARLPELVDQLPNGEELEITHNGHVVAILVGQPKEGQHPVFGRGKGKVLCYSDDEEHLEHFKDYMP